MKKFEFDIPDVMVVYMNKRPIKTWTRDGDTVTFSFPMDVYKFEISKN